ncbi:hypothetical protein LTR37_006401 [Vermiconidia calcicola]|uniref:Uncharacterized protein n=1 Tax=Vermiconidia calcicola TaxID=1690605 RepID=A0ACC3NJB6_9PEZI|nr:hypothetical protein LTR37_006401 [Vermiconidia calcicola]
MAASRALLKEISILKGVLEAHNLILTTNRLSALAVSDMDDNHRTGDDADNTVHTPDEQDTRDRPEEDITSIIGVLLGESQPSDVILPIISGQRIQIIDNTGPEDAESQIQDWWNDHLTSLRSLTQRVQEGSAGWTTIEEVQRNIQFVERILEEGARMGPSTELMDPSPPLLSTLFQQRAPTPSPISSRRSSVLSDSPVSDAARSEQSEYDDDDNDDNDDGIAWLSYEGRLIMSTAGTILPAQGCVELYVSEGAGGAPRRLGVHLCRG